MKECFYFLIVIFIFIGITLINRNQPEFFDIAFGTPPETSSTDAGSMKQLLEIGSQSQADRKYDVVSKSILGKINRTNPPVEEEEPPDPKCFNDFYDFDYDDLKDYQHNSLCSNKISVCCDKPTRREIDIDFDLLDLNGLFEDGLGTASHMDMPDCCCEDSI